MTREDIIRMAQEAGCDIAWAKSLERFAKLVRDDYSNKHANLWLDRCHAYMLAERKACMSICDEAAEDMTDMAKWGAQTCSKLIKARGNP